MRTIRLALEIINHYALGLAVSGLRFIERILAAPLRKQSKRLPLTDNELLDVINGLDNASFFIPNVPRAHQDYVMKGKAKAVSEGLIPLEEFRTLVEQLEDDIRPHLPVFMKVARHGRH